MQVEVALPLPLQNLFSYSVPDNLKERIQIGQRVLVPFRSSFLKGVIVAVDGNGGMAKRDSSTDASNGGKSGLVLKEIRALLDPETPVPPHLLDLTRWMSENYGCTWGESLTVLAPSLKKTKSARKRKGLEIEDSESPRSVESWPNREKEPLTMTGEQALALEPVKQAIRSGTFAAFLLHGVTSSGKTEVYLKAIETAMEKKDPESGEGTQALYLVPEISLCYPFYEILKERFGSCVGIWHSQVSIRERNVLIQGIRDGSVRIVVGARSALFAPLIRHGVIILDEEHDASYKQQEKPRYHARDVALKIAEARKAVVILGSATPSIESFWRARSGSYRLLTLASRIPSHVTPDVTLVDRRTSRAKSSGDKKNLSPLTPALTEAITVAVSRREQVILALNRRGYSTYLLCGSCGTVWKCPDCLLTLVHHQGHGTSEDHLSCHFCLRKTGLPDHCEKCGSSSLHLGGFGTQKVVQEVRKKFPSARILRLDRDVSRVRTASAETYRAFRDENADILVGTQMVIQGFDFPRVTLVGVIDADTALYHPDFRAAERTFQWISQATGRAGRSPLKARVVIQSSMPDHYALQTACFGNYEDFYAKEIEFRKPLHYPPFSRLVLFRIQSSEKKNLVVPESERLADILGSSVLKEGVQILGPGPSPREQLQRYLRWQILAKCGDDRQLAIVLEACRAFQPKAGVRFVIDVDPYDVL